MTNFFNYELVGTGWAKFEIANDRNKSWDFIFSYLADPLPILLNSLNKFLKKESCFERINFAQEPGEISLFFKNLDNDLTIEFYDDVLLDDDYEAIAIDSTKVYFQDDKLLDFSKLVYKEINNLLIEYGESGYHEKWARDFPIAEMNALGKLLNEDGRN